MQIQPTVNDVLNAAAGMLQAALDYAARGWAVFPVHGWQNDCCTCGNKTCERAAKHPVTPNGLLDATVDETVIRGWFADVSRGWNVAIRTGSISGGLAILDVDPAKGGDASLAALLGDIQFDQFETFSVKTGGAGLHYYFTSTHIIRNRVNFRPGLDIRGEGGYVVAAPSVHRTGGSYAILDGFKTILAVLPDTLHTIISANNTPPTVRREGSEGETSAIPSGGRNDYLARVAGTMRRRGLSRAAIEAALLEENNEKCDPPLSDSEVRLIAASISRYEPENPVDTRILQTSSNILRVGDLVEGMFASLRDKDKVRGLSTDIPELDKLLGGGLRLGELSVLCASAKTGKSSWYHYLIYQLLKRGIPVAYASREMRPAEEVIPNLLSIAFGENAWTVDLTADVEEKWRKEVSTWPLYFSRGYGYFPLQEIDAWVTELRQIGVEYYYVDHLHYLLADPEDYKEAVPLAQKFKELTLRENIHINLIVQPGKVADGLELGLNSLRGGAGIGQALDNLFILERHRGPDGALMKNISRLRLEVARHKLARPGHIYLEYEQDTTRFFVVEPEKIDTIPLSDNSVESVNTAANFTGAAQNAPMSEAEVTARANIRAINEFRLALENKKI